MPKKKMSLKINSEVLSAINASPSVLTSLNEIELVVRKHFEREKKYNKNWIASFSMFITLTVTRLSADFKDYIFRSSDWTTIVMIRAIISFLLTAIFLINHIKHKKELGVDTLITRIKDTVRPIRFTQKE